MKYTFFASCPLCMEDLLENELRSMGIQSIKTTRAGVSFQANLEQAYRVCLWSRIANRVFLTLAVFQIHCRDDLYREALQIDWDFHMNAQDTFRVDCSSVGTETVSSNYAVLVLKDALCDYFRSKYGSRPSVQHKKPDISINLHIVRNTATVSLDFAGESLHRRSYRMKGAKAPLKENVAAAILLRVGWPLIASSGGSFIDPMCGSGTILIEAALIAGSAAPGLFRDYYGFTAWKAHKSELWESCLAKAREQYEVEKSKIPLIRGYDNDDRAVAAARENCMKAGLENVTIIEKRNVVSLSAINLKHVKPGLIAFNPPYGHRLGDENELSCLYESLGRMFAESFCGWRVAVLTGHGWLSKSIGLRASKVNTLYNGSLKCTLALFDINEKNRFVPFKKRIGKRE